jgi:hypothetical protein
MSENRNWDVIYKITGHVIGHLMRPVWMKRFWNLTNFKNTDFTLKYKGRSNGCMG